LQKEVASDHVHVIAKLRPSMSPARAVMLMKGYSSRMLFMAEDNELRNFYWKNSKQCSLWDDGKFIDSVGHITLETAKEYIKNHETHDTRLLVKESPSFRGEEVKLKPSQTVRQRLQ
jgi:REP element-mobilizing transposase RayT